MAREHGKPPHVDDRNPFARLVAREHGTIVRHAARRAVLCFPNTYRVAGSSLGFQLLYRLLNEDERLVCERAVLPDDPAAYAARHGRLVSMESGQPVRLADALLCSITYELDLARLVDLLDLAGIEPLAALRPDDAPPLVVGGPLTQSNALPLGPFADVVVLGDAEPVIARLRGWIAEGLSRRELMEACAAVPGLWVPALQGDALPPLLGAGVEDLPALGQTRSPDTELADMMLLETSRGCPRYCKFCVIRAPVAPMRSVPLERIVVALDGPGFRDSPRVGFVGAAVSDWPHIQGALAAAVERGKAVGVSSLRADRLDDAFVDLLRRGGYQTLTVASDAPSERMRGKMMKGLRERHLLAAAEQARRVGMRQLKIYVIIGLPGETEADIEELIGLGQRLSGRIRTVFGISPFVPKLHTPMAADPFEAIGSTEQKAERIRRALGGRVDVRLDPPKWAWIEYRLSQGGQAAGLAALEASRAGGRFGAWKAAFARLDARDPAQERAALAAAERHALWPVTGGR